MYSATQNGKNMEEPSERNTKINGVFTNTEKLRLFLIVINPDDVLRTSRDKHHRLDFNLLLWLWNRYPAKTLTDID